MSNQAELTFARSPFDYDSPGDCIIQSSDGIHFKVIRQFLTTASSVFDDMFAIGTVPANWSLPIVTLAEHSNTLKAFLTMLYPTDIPRPLDHGVMMAIVQAYDKYLIPEDRLRLFAKELWQSPEMLSAAPAQMYALAWRLKMRDEAVIASRYTHKESFENLAKVAPLPGLTALMDMRERRHDAMEGILLQFRASFSPLCRNHQGNTREQFLALRRKVQSAFSAPYPECKNVVSFSVGMRVGVDPVSRVHRQLWPTAVISGCNCIYGVPTDSVPQDIAMLILSFPFTISPPSF